MMLNVEYKDIVLKYTRNLISAFFFSNELNERAQAFSGHSDFCNPEMVNLSYMLNAIIADIMFLREKFGWVLDDKPCLMAQ